MPTFIVQDHIDKNVVYDLRDSGEYVLPIFVGFLEEYKKECRTGKRKGWEWIIPIIILVFCIISTILVLCRFNNHTVLASAITVVVSSGLLFFEDRRLKKIETDTFCERIEKLFCLIKRWSEEEKIEPEWLIEMCDLSEGRKTHNKHLVSTFFLSTFIASIASLLTTLYFKEEVEWTRKNTVLMLLIAALLYLLYILVYMVEIEWQLIMNKKYRYVERLKEELLYIKYKYGMPHVEKAIFSCNTKEENPSISEKEEPVFTDELVDTEEYNVLLKQRDQLVEQIESNKKTFHTLLVTCITLLTAAFSFFSLNHISITYPVILFFSQFLVLICLFVMGLLFAMNDARDSIWAIDDHIKRKYGIKRLLFQGEVGYKQISAIKSRFSWLTLMSVVVVLLDVGLFVTMWPGSDFMAIIGQHIEFVIIFGVELVGIIGFLVNNMIYKMNDRESTVKKIWDRYLK